MDFREVEIIRINGEIMHRESITIRKIMKYLPGFCFMLRFLADVQILALISIPVVEESYDRDYEKKKYGQ